MAGDERRSSAHRAALLTLALACSSGRSHPREQQLPSLGPAAPPTRDSPRAIASLTPPPSASPPSAACSVPSLEQRDPADGRDAAALARCAFQRSGHDAIGDGCAARAHEVSLERLNQAVAPFDAATARHVKAVWARGRELGRNPRAFGLIGDSITASPKFMSPFGAPRSHGLAVPEAAAAELQGPAGSILDHYRGVNVHAGLDSFVAPRAAKVGATSGWALPRGAERDAPAKLLVSRLSPAAVVVMYGSNDATVRFVALDDLVRGFRERMTRLVDYLEGEGVVVVLSTVPRHMHDPARPDCDRRPGDLSNWRIAVQTSAVSAAAAELACERHLPLVDLRHAFDALLNHGIGADGVHPNAHPRGAAILDAEGLRCGYNVRNYVTLRALARLREVVTQ
jgi:hypothetical protein